MKQLADKHNGWGDTSFLLGGWSGPIKEGDFSKWKPDLAMESATINLAAISGRLGNETGPDKREREGDSADGAHGKPGTAHPAGQILFQLFFFLFICSL